ncbi:rhs repeat-associated core domain-containing protein : RHS repeat-associated core domain protein OS=Singulisphaera acidiphila (strain ATCC BAA-1392 / DSM 18658 / VKM B-2454 / MOB10) GN=Sinac_0291 PE=4 SV=1: RHS_repeat: RHS_repeat [Gemmata massiliana]|uniref:Insecticide toxin TcdB middle/N-terminal domain-containing protein n=1 Tax=Gemmata massiliana TaxID=1210884 RepID=A0A6P2CYV6_9BACT|nr:RHS repeat-associated core domain-containing protein [Gemmata massiliana]VTR94318.1 rhs repeat-associated core domain-containing protein : RHS repeat-associated core domain protein OS=Singulisphaera acidiphila (strain ATCC BAA-1392 / DSM 18658 / VKM B-2454 / MOB10) GN=Sinac_0291 PE=4 SV=1: RHS_repeat: RHS_repeat [Gemmata massiliana]
MNRSLTARIPSAFTRLPRLLALRDRLAGLFRVHRAELHAVKLGVEAMEERLVPDGRPLPYPVIFTGSGAGDVAVVKAFDADTGSQRWAKDVYEPSFTGGVRVAAGDITGDGIPDAIIAPGAGHGPRIKVLDGMTGEQIGGELGSFLAYSSSVDGGVFVASGDVDGDGRQDVITATETTGGPRVKVFSGIDGSVLANFLVSGAAFDDGITVAAADFTGDSKSEVVVGGGSNGRVKVYDPLVGDVIAGPLGSFRAFGAGYTGSVFVGSDGLAGDVDGDGVSDLAVGTGAGTTARVKVFSGATGGVLYDFQPFGPSFTGGARVALAFADNDDRADLVVGAGPGGAAQVKVFSGATGLQLDAPLGQYAPFGSSESGVFVAASNDPPTGQVIFSATSDDYHGARVDVTVTLMGDGTYRWDYQVTNNGFWGSSPIAYFSVTFSGTVSVSGIANDRVWLDPANGSNSSVGWSMIPGAPNPIPTGGGTGRFSFTTSPRTIVPALINLDSSTGFTFAGPGAPLPALIPSSLAVVNLPCFNGQINPIAAPPVPNPPPTTSEPIRYVDGVNLVVAPGLSSTGFGAGWGTTLSWSNDLSYSVGTSAGNGWVAGGQSRLYRTGASLYLVTDATTAYFFDGQGTPDADGNYATYAPRFFDNTTVAYDGTNDLFVITAGDGTVYRYLDFGSPRPLATRGAFQSRTDPGGLVTQVTSRDTDGRPLEVQSAQTVGGVTTTESYLYAYLGTGDANAGKMSSVTLRRRVGAGGWATVQQVGYVYYATGGANGNWGDLKRLTVSDAAGAVLDQRYYRYYTADTFSGATQIGYRGGLKYELGPDAYARLKAASGGTDAAVEAAADTTVATYADRYFEYDAQHRASKETVSGAGCTSCSAGQGTYTYTYTPSSNAAGHNSWAMKTVETRPDGSTNTVYTNAYGGVMLTAFADAATGLVSITYYQYDSKGRVVLVANPSAVTGYSDTYSDLVRFVSGNAQYLSDSSGLVTNYTYGASTTATTLVPGDAVWYLKAIAIRQGEASAAVPQESLAYIMNTVGGINFFHLASDTVYRNDNGTGGQTTNYTYTFLSGTNQVASVTATLPTVTTAQNGSNSATAATIVSDTFGRPVWTKDAAGFITYAEYDAATGAVVKSITDVNTSLTGTFANLPSGWSTPSGAGLHLTTIYEVDSLGRTTKATYPNGRVDYTIYNDAAHEVRYYAGWDTATNRPTGPTTVVRVNRANGYTETLTMSAAPAVSSGRPTGAEAVSQVQSLSRSYTNEASQVTHTDAYFNLSGLTYSTSVALGTEGVNFYRTRYEYDNTGQLKRVQTPQGTITRYVRNGFGEIVSEWVGTDDAPTSGYWSPANTAGTNLVKVREYQYDNGAVGDGNLTKMTEYPGGAGAARVTQTWFDWRNRAVAVKSGVEASEATSVNRPLVYYTYDNLDQVTMTRMYDADGVTPTVIAGVPQPLSSSLLRAQGTAEYDELGRAFRTRTYSVNPTTGAVSTNSLVTDTWYDARGLLIKASAPNGLVRKWAYDGAGRTTTAYVGDWGSDTGYADADDVVGDTVLTQTEYAYDASGNVLQTTTRERFHDATGTGALGTPATGVAARVSYMGYYYDKADRTIVAVNVGTNGGTAWTRPGSAPSGSATVLVSATRYATDAVQTVALAGATGGTFTLSFGGSTTGAIAYNASAATVQTALAGLASIGAGNVQVSAAAGGGWEVRFTGAKAGAYQSALTSNGSGLTGGGPATVLVSTVNAGGDAGRSAEGTDSVGRVTRIYTDALGRTTRTIANFVDGVVSDTDDKTTGYAYNGAGMTSLTAYLTGGGVQTTEYVYGVSSATGSAIESNEIVRLTQWADPSSGAASAIEQETVTVNALGQAVTTTDRNGNVHVLTYDVLGRVVSDSVTASGTNVGMIETSYDTRGNVSLVTSRDATNAIVNQVAREYNGLGQLTAEWQSHSGAVTGSTPKVQYAYNFNGNGTTNQSRLTSITYPSGYVLTYNYASGISSAISRLSSLSDPGGAVESYDYLGLDTVVRRAHSGPSLDLSYVKRTGESNGDAGDQYTGLDRFGRVVDQRWLNPTTGTATDRFQYGYDTAGNRTYRDNLVNTAFGEAYTYDALNQLTGYDRGTLNGTKTGITGTVARSQDWDYDAVGNWDSVTTNGTAQTRTANKQNEITGISGGAITPTYDNNGNMTRDETGKLFVYDAWNRLVAVKNSGGTTLKTYSYDGLNRRVSETASGTTTDLFYSNQWQVLEEKVGSNTTNRYVWSAVYVDAMVLRDRDTNADGTPDERLWVQQDANWNVTALVNSSGTVVERYTYDPFGVRTVYDANWAVRAGGSTYGFVQGFQGMTFDATAGLSHQRMRWYSPTLGRWVSLDPIRFSAGDVNFYRTIGNQPTNTTDPSGLVWPASAIVGGLVGGIVGGGGQLVSNLIEGRPTWQGVGGAAAGGAVTGAIVGTVGPAGFAATAGTGAAAGGVGSATGSTINQYYQTGTVNGGQVLQSTVTGALAGGVGGGVGSTVAGRLGVNVLSPIQGRIGAGAIAGGAGGFSGGATAGALGAYINDQDPVTGAFSGGLTGAFSGATGGSLSAAFPVTTFMNSQQYAVHNSLMTTYQYNLLAANPIGGAVSAHAGPQGQLVLATSQNAGPRPGHHPVIAARWPINAANLPPHHPRMTCGEPAALSLYHDSWPTSGSTIGTINMTTGQILPPCPSCAPNLPIFGVSHAYGFPPYITPVINPNEVYNID